MGCRVRGVIGIRDATGFMISWVMVVVGLCALIPKP